MKERYKTEKLSAMNLPKNFFGNGGIFNETDTFPDLNATWQRATWPMHELEVDWSRYEGVNMLPTSSSHTDFFFKIVGFDASARVIGVNTIYLGQCYLIMADKNEQLSYKWGTGIMINLASDDSVARLYVMPSTQKSEKSAIVDRWNYPIKHLELHNDQFLKLTLTKEIHVRKSTIGSPCTDLHEENYYKVRFFL